MGILTTVVGSYPVPDWLASLPSEQALIDAMAVILKTQENAGIDVIADGELGRFDVNHPETNGMIEYFVKPLENVRGEVTRADVDAFRKDAGMSFRVRPSAVVDGPIGEGALDLPGDFAIPRWYRDDLTVLDLEPIRTGYVDIASWFRDGRDTLGACDLKLYFVGLLSAFS